MSDPVAHHGTPKVPGARLIAISAVISFLLAITAYFLPHGAVAHSWGALLVVISTALLLIASLWIAMGWLPRWLLVLFDVLIILDIAGTGICAYFLETYILLAFMVIAFIGWIVHLANDSPRLSAP